MSSFATIREGLQPGDLGAIVALHGRVYADEHGFDETFEPYVAGALAEFALLSDAGGKIWVAEKRDGQLLGSIAIVRTGKREAQLRWFVLAKEARGEGLGRALCDRASRYMDAAGFTDVTLWTFDGLDSAARLYSRMGFAETARKAGTLGGQAVAEIQMTWRRSTASA